MARFELSERQDGKWNKWEMLSAASLGLVDQEAVDIGAIRDYRVWVVTGVFNSKREVFKDMPRKRRAKVKA